jgi:hypothetical protein
MLLPQIPFASVINGNETARIHTTGQEIHAALNAPEFMLAGGRLNKNAVRGEERHKPLPDTAVFHWLCGDHEHPRSRSIDLQHSRSKQRGELCARRRDIDHEIRANLSERPAEPPTQKETIDTKLRSDSQGMNGVSLLPMIQQILREIVYTLVREPMQPFAQNAYLSDLAQRTNSS